MKVAPDAIRITSAAPVDVGLVITGDPLTSFVRSPVPLAVGLVILGVP